jgi:hypothetical protein
MNIVQAKQIQSGGLSWLEVRPLSSRLERDRGKKCVVLLTIPQGKYTIVQCQRDTNVYGMTTASEKVATSLTSPWNSIPVK